MKSKECKQGLHQGCVYTHGEDAECECTSAVHATQEPEPTADTDQDAGQETDQDTSQDTPLVQEFNQ